MKNVGHSCLKIGKFNDAVQAYEEIMENQPEHSICFNLFLCYYAMQDNSRMKNVFQQLCGIEFPEGDTEDDLDNSQRDVTVKEDPLSKYLKEKKSEAISTITKAGRMLAPLIQPDNV